MRTLLANKHEFSEGRGGSKWLIACSLAIFENRGTRWLKKYVLSNVCLVVHSPEIRGLCFMELSPDMHQDLPNFWEYENPHFFFISCYDLFFPSLCWHSPGYSFIMKKIKILEWNVFLDKHEHPISEEWPVVSNNISFLSMWKDFFSYSEHSKMKVIFLLYFL